MHWSMTGHAVGLLRLAEHEVWDRIIALMVELLQKHDSTPVGSPRRGHYRALLNKLGWILDKISQDASVWPERVETDYIPKLQKQYNILKLTLKDYLETGNPGGIDFIEPYKK